MNSSSEFLFLIIYIDEALDFKDFLTLSACRDSLSTSLVAADTSSHKLPRGQNL